MTKTLLEVWNTKTEEPPKQLKPIVFKSKVDGEPYGIEPAKLCPRDWDNVILLKKGRNEDTMFAWDSFHPNDGCVYFGKWNDGVKE